MTTSGSAAVRRGGSWESSASSRLNGTGPLLGRWRCWSGLKRWSWTPGTFRTLLCRAHAESGRSQHQRGPSIVTEWQTAKRSTRYAISRNDFNVTQRRFAMHLCVHSEGLLRLTRYFLSMPSLLSLPCPFVYPLLKELGRYPYPYKRLSGSCYTTFVYPFLYQTFTDPLLYMARALNHLLLEGVQTIFAAAIVDTETVRDLLNMYQTPSHDATYAEHLQQAAASSPIALLRRWGSSQALLWIGDGRVVRSAGS
jgi:hypothetical protein